MNSAHNNIREDKLYYTMVIDTALIQILQLSLNKHLHIAADSISMWAAAVYSKGSSISY